LKRIHINVFLIKWIFGIYIFFFFDFICSSPNMLFKTAHFSERL
jgi:hypothetical protein